MFDPKASEPYQNIDISNVAKHSSPCSYHGLFYGHAMFIGNSQKEARYLSFPVFIAVWFIAIKVTADILITFAG